MGLSDLFDFNRLAGGATQTSSPGAPMFGGPMPGGGGIFDALTGNGLKDLLAIQAARGTGGSPAPTPNAQPPAIPNLQQTPAAAPPTDTLATILQGMGGPAPQPQSLGSMGMGADPLGAEQLLLGMMGRGGNSPMTLGQIFGRS